MGKKKSKMNLKRILINSTNNSPKVEFDPELGYLAFTGKSIPENATKLYHPLSLWIKEYVKVAREETNLHLNLEYFNTASSIWIARLIKFLSQIDDPEKLLIIHLYFDIEEFDEMEEEDVKEAIAPATDVISDAKLSVGIKIYGKDGNDSILKEKLVLF